MSNWLIALIYVMPGLLMYVRIEVRDNGSRQVLRHTLRVIDWPFLLGFMLIGTLMCLIMVYELFFGPLDKDQEPLYKGFIQKKP